MFPEKVNQLPAFFSEPLLDRRHKRLHPALLTNGSVHTWRIITIYVSYPIHAGTPEGAKAGPLTLGPARPAPDSEADATGPVRVVAPSCTLVSTGLITRLVSRAAKVGGAIVPPPTVGADAPGAATGCVTRICSSSGRYRAIAPAVGGYEGNNRRRGGATT